MKDATGNFEADENDRPGIHFKPIEKTGKPRFRLMFHDIIAIENGEPIYEPVNEGGCLVIPITRRLETIWFDCHAGLLGLKANGDLT